MKDAIYIDEALKSYAPAKTDTVASRGGAEIALTAGGLTVNAHVGDIVLVTAEGGAAMNVTFTPGRVECPICHATFDKGSFIRSLNNHMIHVHNSYFCYECGLILATKTALKWHKRKCEGAGRP